MTLAQMAACKIRFQTLSDLHPIYKFVIHFELSPYFIRTRITRNQSYAQMCSCAEKCHDGSCLCYLQAIYWEIMEMYWGDPNEYEFLSRFTEFGN